MTAVGRDMTAVGRDMTAGQAVIMTAGEAVIMTAGEAVIMTRTLNDLRNDIDRVDEVLVRLLNERARCACEIGRLKKELGIEIYQPEREKEVLKHVRDVASEGPLGPDAISRLFERIIDEARRLERRVVHGEDSTPDDEAAAKAEPNLKSET